jgi:hypothetical protein
MKKPLLIGCAVVFAFILAAIAAGIFFVSYASQDPKGLLVQLDGPAEVKQGETFDLIVNVVNERSSKPLKVSSIDIDEDYLKAFAVVSTEPRARSSQHVPVDDSRSYEFNVSVPPKGTNVFKFRLRAREKGVFSGDIDVCEGTRFLTTVVETEVK